MPAHTLIARETIPLQLAVRHFSTLASSPEVDLAVAVDWFHQATVTLSLADCVRDLVGFAEKNEKRISTPEPLLEALFSLEGLRASLNWSGKKLTEFLLEAAADEAAKPASERTISADFDSSSLARHLNRFFDESTKLETTLRAQLIYDGLLPNFDSCSSLVEFRPVFNQSREEIVSGLVVATLCIETRTNPESSLERTSFQVDAKDLDALISELTRLKSKLLALKGFAEGQTTLLNPSHSLPHGK